MAFSCEVMPVVWIVKRTQVLLSPGKNHRTTRAILLSSPSPPYFAPKYLFASLEDASRFASKDLPGV